MAGKKEVKKTVQFDEDEVERITKAMVAHDAGFSEVVRAACEVGLPLLNYKPSLIKMIGALQSNENREISG